MLLEKILLIKFISLLVSFTFVMSLTDQDFHFVGHVNKNQRIMGNIGTAKYTPPQEKDPEFWRSLANRELARRLATVPNYQRARNIIFFLGDGMSLSTVTAARIHKGQLKGNTGEEDSLFFERFPWVGLSKTYCSNAQVADSACSSTAYLCGVKANIMTLGVSANVEYNNCSMSMNPKNHVSSLIDWAQKAGKSTGFITTTTLTHASPAGIYAHAANRFWESDADISSDQQDRSTCMDIAQQLIKQSPGRHLDVMMGGGMGKLLPNAITDAHGLQGERKDGQNLLQLWKNMHPHGAIVTNRTQLLNLNIKQVDKIMGIFASQVMEFHAHADNRKQPRLAEMTEVALKFLSQKSKKGFVLFVEGGRIDHGNHLNQPGISIDETLQFEKAIEVAYNMTNHRNTLIVVTADHSHPLSISGYPGRGTPILGVNQHNVDSNGEKYPTLNYALGPKPYSGVGGKTINWENILVDIDSTHPSQIPGKVGVHAGDDVGIFASGPFSQLFGGVLQQNSIPHFMAYAAGIKKYK